MPARRLWPWDQCRTTTTTAFRFASITTFRHRLMADMVGSSCSPASCATWSWTGSLTPSACSSANSSNISVKARARLLGSVAFCPECTSAQVCCVSHSYVERRSPDQKKICLKHVSTTFLGLDLALERCFRENPAKIETIGTDMAILCLSCM